VRGDAPAHGQGPHREAPEDAGEEIFREEVHGWMPTAGLISFCSIGIGIWVQQWRFIYRFAGTREPIEQLNHIGNLMLSLHYSDSSSPV
jgi:hypothetical protein